MGELYLRYQQKESGELLQLLEEARGAIKALESELRYCVGSAAMREKRSLLAARQEEKGAIVAALKQRGQYVPTEEEARAEEFESKLGTLREARFSYGGFLGGFTVVTLSLEGERVKRKISSRTEEEREETLYATAEQLKDELKSLRIGEWQRSYVNPMILDGFQWRLCFTYADGSEERFEGSNAYPHNFRELKRLFGIEKY